MARRFYMKRWRHDLFAVFEDGKTNPIETGDFDTIKRRLAHETEMADLNDRIAELPFRETIDPNRIAETLWPSVDRFKERYSDPNPAFALPSYPMSDEEWIEDEPDLDDDYLYERRGDR